jgi:hypothetical protein
MRNRLLMVHQHGGDDVTCKPRICHKIRAREGRGQIHASGRFYSLRQYLQLQKKGTYLTEDSCTLEREAWSNPRGFVLYNKGFSCAFALKCQWVVLHGITICSIPLLDTDECEYYPCDHECHNTPGSFYCTCKKGYTIQMDKLSCKGTSCKV